MGGHQNNSRYYCKVCMSQFYSHAKRASHQAECAQHGLQTIKFPKENSFQANPAQYAMPYCFYVVADFETICSSLLDTELVDSNRSYTVYEEVHKQYCISWALISPKGSIEVGYFVWDDAIERFVNRMLDLSEELMKLINVRGEEIIMNSEELTAHYLATKCYVCKQYFTVSNPKVIHHSHLAEGVSPSDRLYIGSPCRNCNLRLKHKLELPILFHNSTIKRCRAKKINCTAKNSEKIMCLQLDNIRFMDSMMHLPSGLKSLVDSLRQDGLHKFPITAKYFKKHGNYLEKIIAKQRMCYEYLSPETLQKGFPTRDKFFSKLHKKPLSIEDYCHAFQIYVLFGCKNLGEYVKIYCILDTLLLADVFESYREEALKQFQIDPLYFVLGSSFTFACALKLTNVRLDYIKDPDILLKFKESIRGGLTGLNTRYVEANIPNTETFNQSEPISEIAYYDITSLWALYITLHIEGRTIDHAAQPH